MYSFALALSTHNKPPCLPTQPLRTSANSSIGQLQLFPHKSTECRTATCYEQYPDLHLYIFIDLLMNLTSTQEEHFKMMSQLEDEDCVHLYWQK